jgi:hypothetical protein
MRRQVMVLACASVAAGLLLGPVPAASAAVAPELVWAGSDGPSSGVAKLSARSDSAITSITAHLYAPDAPEGAAEVARVDDFTLESGTGQQGIWKATSPVRLADLDTYRIVVDLTDADGDTSTTEDSDGFAYWLTANLTDFQVTPEQPDHTHQQVSVSGRYTITDPRTGQTTPAAGEVDVHTSNFGDTSTTRTDAEGDFSVSYTHTYEYGGTVSSWLRLSAEEPMWQNATTVSVRPVRAETRVTLDDSVLAIEEGDTAEISGRAEVLLDGSWQPLAGATVSEAWSTEFGGVRDRPVTGADGRFSGSLAMPQTGTVEVNVVGGTYLATSPTQTVKVYVARETSIGGFTVSLNKYSQLTAKGRMFTGSSHPSEEYDKIRLQYSADGRTDWKTLKTVAPTSHDPEEGNPFKGTFAAPSKGYYRAYFAGNRSWQPAYSEVKYAKRTKTRIIDGNASPEPVRKGRTITVKGTLQHYTSSAWRAYADQKVKILFRPKGSTTWYDMGNATTRSNGSFSKGLTAQKDGTWVAVHLYPNSSHLVGSGREDYVDVT